MPGKVIIGVTGPDRGGLVAWLMTAWAVRRSGGRPVRITPSRPRDANSLAGIVIGGGTDVDPFHYGETVPVQEQDQPDQTGSAVDWMIGLVLSLVRMIFATRSIQDYDPDRDQLEKHLIQYALYNQLPVLGICRGAQLMNVALGGTLHQDIGHFYSEGTSNVRSILPRKRIDIAPQSCLQRTLQTASCTVNALHDQSIKDAGEQVTVSARESTGVVQAIECNGHRYFIGVQWHPEYMPQSRIQLRLFQALVQHAMETPCN